MKIYGVLNYIKSQRFNRVFALSASLFLLLLLITTIVPVYQKIEYTKATAGTATASTLTFSSDNSVASVNLSVNSPTGTFATSDENEKAKFSINTNNYTGYTLVLKSSGTNTNLAGNNINIATIPATTTYETFSSDSASGQLLNNKWGYIPSYYNSSANTTNYYPSPTSSDVATINITNSANSSDDTYTIGLGFRADYTNPSGTYANETFILEFVANYIDFVITYDKNTTDTVTNMPYSSTNNQQVGSTSATSITLSDLVPVRTSYEFLGWCLGTVTTTNGLDTCSGTVYNPNGSGTDLIFGIDQTIGNTLTLYAMWDRVYTLTFLTAGNATNIVFNGETYTNNQTKTIRASELTNPYHIYGNYAARYAFSSWAKTAGTFGNQGYQNTTYTVTDDATITLTGQQTTIAMQNLSLASCSTTAIPVYDNRDDSVYWIQKLPDGNCWMLDNLALDLTDSNVQVVLEESNTNASDTTLGYLKGTTTRNPDTDPDGAYATAGVSSVWTSSGQDYFSIPMTNTESLNTTMIPSAANDIPGYYKGFFGIGQGKVGGYYNYCAASAGSYCFGNGTSSGTSSGDATEDICPVGWRMPTGKRAAGEFWKLCSAIKGSSCTQVDSGYDSMDATDPNSIQTILSTAFTGYYRSGSINSRGISDDFWSSTRYDDSWMYYLYVLDSSVHPQAVHLRDIGRSMRCIISPSLTVTVDSYVSDVTLKVGSTSGTTVTGTKSGNTITFKNLQQGVDYYLYPTFVSGYEFGSWTKTDSATGSALGSTSTENTYYTVGSSDGGLALASAASGGSAQPVACPGGKICYSPGPSSVTDSMGNQSIGSSDTSAVLWASNFKRQGYGFAGWTDKYNWVVGANDASGNGTGTNAGYHIYGPNATIAFTAGQYSAEGLSLYAVWVPSAGNLQNWNGCNSMSIGAVTALTDLRDNDTYAVAKLADGKCWMIENLRLDYDADFTESLSQGFGKSTTYGNFIGLARPETANFTASTSSATDPTTANSIYYAGTQSGTATINISQTSYAGFRMPRYRNDNTNTDSTINPNTTVANMTSTSQNIYSYGNYYTWSAALANTIYYDSPTATDADGKTSETVNTSLCPAGWKLPRGGNKSREATNDFWTLIVTGINGGTNPANYDSSTTPYYTGDPEGTNASITLRNYPNNFLYSGLADISSVISRGSYGVYWSSTAYDSNSSYRLVPSRVNVYPGTNYNFKYSGYSIRCLAGS